MSRPAQRFIIDTETGKLVSAFGSISGTTQPVFYVGDIAPVEVYLVNQSGPGTELTNQLFPAGATVRMGVGSVNASPTTGTWHIGFGSDMSGPLTYNATAAELQTALNGLSSVSSLGGLTVDKVGAQYRIAWNTNGTRGLFVPGSDTLVPAADIQQQTLQYGNSTQPAIVMLALAVRPISLTDYFETLDPISGTFSDTNYQINGSAAGGGYRLKFTYTQGTTTKLVWTDTIPYVANAQSISQYIYNALVNSGWGYVSETNPTVNSWGILVTPISDNNYRLDFVAPQFKNPIAVVAPKLVDIDVSEITIYDGRKTLLAVNTVEAVAYLGTKESTRAYLEVEISAGGEVQTVLQTSCTICGQVIQNGTYSVVPLETPLTQTVGDSRYLRRDGDQATDSTSLNQLWENLTGQTAVAGVDIAGALGAASAPSAGNPLATIADLGTPFDQTLNTTDAVNFLGVTTGAGGITFSDSTVLTTANPFDQLLNTTNSVSFTDVAATNNVTADNAIFTPGSVYVSGGLGGKQIEMSSTGLDMNEAGMRILFPTTNTLSDVNGGGGVATGSSGTYITSGDYPLEVLITVNGIQYAVPARTV